MNQIQRQKLIAELYSKGFGRPTILDKVDGATEWEVRKTIRELKKGNLDVPASVVEAAKKNGRKTAMEVIADLRPINVNVPKNKTVRSSDSNGMMTIAFVSDTHGQFVDERALDITCQIISDLNPDMLVHLGDLGDFYSISSHDKNPHRKQLLQDDLTAASRVLGKLDQTVPDGTRKILVEGNHEDRLRRYIWNVAPALAGLEHLKMENLLGLPDLGWEFVQSDLELLPEFIIKHGSFVSSKAGYTAQKEISRAWMSGISGHTHRLAVHSYTPTRSYVKSQRPFIWIENGCLCDTSAEYLNAPGDWQQGFTIVRFDKDGPMPELVNIFNGKAVFGGRTYKS